MTTAREKVTAASPELAPLIDACKQRFQASLLYVRAGGYEAGSLGVYAEPGCQWTVYTPPKVRK
jgi:hypothetical protein